MRSQHRLPWRMAEGENGRVIPSDLVENLRRAHHVAVLTGSGISAESGVPTFRDAQTGLWARFQPEELATAQAFRRDPKLVWEWYAWRRELVARASPNAGHLALVSMQARVPVFTLITQNVDGLHQRAGSHGVIELHGSLARNRCFNEGVVVDSWQETGAIPPRCPRCGGSLRPDVVWFGEALPAGALETGLHAVRTCDLLLTIGTSAMVQPAAALPYEALMRGIAVAEINLGETPLSTEATFALHGKAGEILPELVRATWG
ncbi:MAG: NAD-dependent deacylase [Planctomycetota bacterium]